MTIRDDARQYETIRDDARRYEAFDKADEFETSLFSIPDVGNEGEGVLAPFYRVIYII